jgi:serine/threonine-protein kinase
VSKGEQKDRRDPLAPDSDPYGLTQPQGRGDEGTLKIPASDEDLPGRLRGSGPRKIGKHYRVIRKIGEGGMGSVYEVEHERMQKRFAAKVIRRRYSDDEEALKRFELEAIAAGKIESDHIVQVVYLDTEKEYTYIVMELLRGRSLASIVRKRRLDVSLAVEIARQIARGLIAAHQVDIVHRDLKPENVFLSEREGKVVVKILDFGISKMLGSMHDVSITKTGQLVGTPLYFSPEQARNSRDIDQRTDIYSLGIILFEMLTGVPTFVSTSPVELIYKHLSEQPARPSTLNPEVDDRLEKVVLRCLEKDPGDRYQSADELLADLDMVAFGNVDVSTLNLQTPLAAPEPADTTKMGLSFTREGHGGRNRVVLIAVFAGVLLAAGLAVAFLGTDLWKQQGGTATSGSDAPPPAAEEPVGAGPERDARQPSSPPPPVLDAGTDPASHDDTPEVALEPSKSPRKPSKVKPPAKKPVKEPAGKKPSGGASPEPEPGDEPKKPEADWTYPGVNP